VQKYVSISGISIPSSLIAPRTLEPLAPAMLAALWEIAAVLDERRVASVVEDAVWLEIPTKRLRGEGGRDDNAWMRKCLDRLAGLKLSGEYRGDPWGAERQSRRPLPIAKNIRLGDPKPSALFGGADFR